MTTACAKRDGALWHCYSRQQNETAGYTYLFKIREEYDDVTLGADLEHRKIAAREKIAHMHPSVEPSADELCPKSDSGLRGTAFVENKTLYFEENKKLIINKVNRQLRVTSSEGRKLLMQYIDTKIEQTYQREINLLFLGYRVEAKSDGVYMEAPDHKTLITRWNRLRETNKRLPPISIASKKKPCDDISFTLSYLSYDALLSTRQQFVHDNWLHVRPVLSMIQTPTTEFPWDFARDVRASGELAYLYQRRKLEKLLVEGIRAIDLLKKINTNNLITLQFEASLGILTDTIFNIGHLTKTLTFSTSTWDECLSTIWTTPHWHDYLIKRFGKAIIGADQFFTLLNSIKTQLHPIFLPL